MMTLVVIDVDDGDNEYDDYDYNNVGDDNNDWHDGNDDDNGNSKVINHSKVMIPLTFLLIPRTYHVGFEVICVSSEGKGSAQFEKKMSGDYR